MGVLAAGGWSGVFGDIDGVGDGGIIDLDDRVSLCDTFRWLWLCR